MTMPPREWLVKQGHYPAKNHLGCACCGMSFHAIAEGFRCPLTPEEKFELVETGERADAMTTQHELNKRGQGEKIDIDEWMNNVRKRCGL